MMPHFLVGPPDMLDTVRFICALSPQTVRDFGAAHQTR